MTQTSAETANDMNQVSAVKQRFLQVKLICVIETFHGSFHDIFDLR